MNMFIYNLDLVLNILVFFVFCSNICVVLKAKQEGGLDKCLAVLFTSCILFYDSQFSFQKHCEL